MGVQSRKIIKRPLAPEEIDELVKIRGAKLTYDGDAQFFLLGALKASANRLEILNGSLICSEVSHGTIGKEEKQR